MIQQRPIKNRFFAYAHTTTQDQEAFLDERPMKSCELSWKSALIIK